MLATTRNAFFDFSGWLPYAMLKGMSVLALTLYATATLGQHLAVRNYTVKDGLTRNGIRAICQDADGWMWFATTDGIDRYDGAEFTHFTTAEGLPSDFINDIVEDRTGAIWIATNFAGISRCRNAREFHQFLPSPHSPSARSNRVNKLFVDSQDRLWVATDGGFFAFRDSTFIPVDGQITALTVAEDSAGTIWVGTMSGLMKVVETDTRSHLELVQGNIEVYALACDHDGLLWVGTTAGLFLPPTASATKQPWQREGLIRYLRKEQIRALLVDPENTLWIGLDGRGIARFSRDGMLTTFDETNGFAGNGVRAMFRDREGNLWFGTTTGLSKLTNEHIVNYTRVHGLPDYAVTSASRDDTGVMWFGTRFGVTRLDNGRMRTFTTRDGLASNYVLVVFTDAAGTVWCGTEGGPSKFEPTQQRFRSYGPREGWTEREGKQNRVRAIHQDEEGNLWFGSDEGVNLYRHGRFVSYPIEGNYGDRLVAGLARDAGGDLWAGLHGGGILRFRVSANENHTPILRLKQRIGIADGLKDDQIRCAWKTRDGSLWFGTRFGGAIRIGVDGLRISSIKCYTTADGLASNWVNGMVEDRKGNLWLATSRGVNRLSFLSPDSDVPGISTLSVFDGLAGEGINAVYEDVNGLLWFATYNGVTQYDPAGDMTAHVQPAIYITGVVVSGQEDTAALRTMQMTLPYHHQSIAFDFVGISFRDEARVQYSYILEGFDSAWCAPTKRRYAQYTHLPPGDYRFKVRARNADGVWSSFPATFFFTVDTPLWARGWFVVSALSIVATVLWLVHRYRVRQALALERVRLRIAADLHDDVGSTLSSIAIASEMARRENATNRAHTADALARISTNARAMLERLDDIVWSINPSNDSLDEVLLRMKAFAADALEARGITYSMAFPDHTNGVTIPMEQRRHLYLMFKEAVTNVAKHSECANAEIRLELGPNRLSLTVRDNGRGFDPHAGSAGDGLRNMQQRAAALSAEFIIDAAPGKGTTVRLVAPFT